jgi:Uma2 family endonuclease
MLAQDTSSTCGAQMSQPKHRPATYADIEALPPHITGEILFGVLHTQPRPVPRHGVAAGGLQGELFDPFGRRRGGGPGGWLFIPEPELHLGSHIVVPDIAGWRRDRMPKLPGTAWIETPPDWVCEVMSPSTQRKDRTDKLAIYAAFGVSHCWYVDPSLQMLEVFALTGSKWLLTATFKDADRVCAPPFEAHTFALDVLWAEEEGGGDAQLCC